MVNVDDYDWKAILRCISVWRKSWTEVAEHLETVFSYLLNKI